ncbi:MAG: sugar transferase, partial [Acidobacteriota bacterium]|nr:sugar transferase [Acidobacteriota bacterium]
TLSVVAGIPLLGSKGNNITGFNYVLKRLVDIAVSAVLLVIFSPLMLLVALAIKIFSKGPVLFSQERIGYRGRPFKFYKFRSMHVANDPSIHQDYVKKWIEGDKAAEVQDGDTKVHKITRDPRIIPWVGPFIRKFSIDELPQLFNVIKGDMSLVGPRPCLPYEAEMYRRWHKMRFDALPGITGLWQVSGRNRLSFDQMVALDIRYLQNWSLGLDLQIMAKTPYIILFDKAY